MNMPQLPVFMCFKRFCRLMVDYWRGDNGSKELEMALYEVYSLFYMDDRQWYTHINERWGIV